MPFTFHEKLPQGSKLNVDQGIFHDLNHLTLQASSGWCSFYLIRENQVNGMIHFHLEGTLASSPCRSTFGSYIFSESVPESIMEEFVAFCENQLLSKGVNMLFLKHQPEQYSEKNTRTLQTVLTRKGYSITNEESSAIITVGNHSFESGVHRSEKKRLRKCREHGLRFEIMPLSQLSKIYSFLESCRKEKGYSLSMSLRELEALVHAFPKRIILTVVIDKNKIAAGNISIRVYEHVLYNFYHDHAGEYDLLSPVVLLNEGLYQFCQKQNIQFLDLGTSQTGEKVNESLLNFKINLGAKISRKLTFTKNLV